MSCSQPWFFYTPFSASWRSRGERFLLYAVVAQNPWTQGLCQKHLKPRSEITLSTRSLTTTPSPLVKHPVAVWWGMSAVGRTKRTARLTRANRVALGCALGFQACLLLTGSC